MINVERGVEHLGTTVAVAGSAAPPTVAVVVEVLPSVVACVAGAAAVVGSVAQTGVVGVSC